MEIRAPNMIILDGRCFPARCETQVWYGCTSGTETLEQTDVIYIVQSCLAPAQNTMRPPERLLITHKVRTRIPGASPSQSRGRLSMYGETAIAKKSERAIHSCEDIVKALKGHALLQSCNLRQSVE